MDGSLDAAAQEPTEEPVDQQQPMDQDNVAQEPGVWAPPTCNDPNLVDHQGQPPISWPNELQWPSFSIHVYGGDMDACSWQSDNPVSEASQSSQHDTGGSSSAAMPDLPAPGVPKSFAPTPLAPAPP
jgi:hypothetical protein